MVLYYKTQNNFSAKRVENKAAEDISFLHKHRQIAQVIDGLCVFLVCYGTALLRDACLFLGFYILWKAFTKVNLYRLES